MTCIDISFHTSLDRETTKELQQCWTVSAWSLPWCCSAKQADNSFCCCSDIYWYLPFTQAWIEKPLKSCSSTGQTVLALFPCAALPNRLATAFCHCSDLLIFVFAQAWIGKPLKSCSSAGQTVLGLFPCAALQNRLATVFCHSSGIYWYLPFTQAFIEKPLKIAAVLDRQCLVSSPVLLCKTSWQQLFVTAMTPIDICFHTSLDRETTKELQQCWTVSAWSLPWCCSAKQADNSFCCCSDIYWYLPFTQAWIEKPLKSCSSTGQTVLALFPCAALPNRLATAFCHCSDLLIFVFAQAWIGKPLKSCSSAGQTMLGRFPCAALQNRLTTAFCHSSGMYWYLTVTKAWIEKPLKNCSSTGQTVLGLFPCAALQNKLATAFCHCNDTY